MFSFLIALVQQISEFSTSAHGRLYQPPEGILFYLIVILSWLIVGGVTLWAVKLLFWPGEKSENHIKRKILEEK